MFPLNLTRGLGSALVAHVQDGDLLKYIYYFNKTNQFEKQNNSWEARRSIRNNEALGSLEKKEIEII